MTAADLAAAGFTASNDGALHAAGCQVEINPVGAQFYQVQITVGTNLAVTTVVHESAIKVTRESKNSR